jgi:hypothetical protein
MDSVLKEFLASGKTLITDTLERKSKPVDTKKISKATMETVPALLPGSWDKVLISRCRDEKIKKADIIVEFKKIIAQEEALI